MKKLIFSTAILFATLLLSATNEPRTSNLNVIESEKSIVLDFSGTIDNADSFSITDANGDVIFNHTIEKNAVKYNLKKLPVGQYTLKVEGANFVEFHKTVISRDAVNVMNTKTYYKPTMTKVNEKINVDAIFMDQQDISVSIYDAAGETVYTFSADDKVGAFNKTFNLEHLAAGNYSMIISTDYFLETSKFSL